RVVLLSFFFTSRRSPRSTLFPYTTLFRSARHPADGRRAVSTRHRAGHRAGRDRRRSAPRRRDRGRRCREPRGGRRRDPPTVSSRSEEHTSELQSRVDLVCRLLLEKKKKNK